MIDPLSRKARDATAASSDPAEAKALLESAQRIEEANRQFRQSLDDVQRDIEKAKLVAKDLRRGNQLPWWVVAVVLALFLAFLVFVAMKHHV